MNVNFYTPVVTAFDENGNLDLQGNQNIYDHLINGGIGGLLILGSSGEFYAMSMEQKILQGLLLIPATLHFATSA